MEIKNNNIINLDNSLYQDYYSKEGQEKLIEEKKSLNQWIDENEKIINRRHNRWSKSTGAGN
jgi:hypothetical protein